MKDTQTGEEDRLTYEIVLAVRILLLRHACAQLFRDSFHKMENPGRSVILLPSKLPHTHTVQVSRIYSFLTNAKFLTKVWLIYFHHLTLLSLAHVLSLGWPSQA